MATLLLLVTLAQVSRVLFPMPCHQFATAQTATLAAAGSTVCSHLFSPADTYHTYRFGVVSPLPKGWGTMPCAC